MRLKPGSPLWLLKHELLLAWRNFSQTSAIFVIAAGLFWLFFHFAAFQIMRNLSLETLDGPAVIVPGFIVLVGLTLVLSSAIVLSVNALYDRGDLDLLISSPLPTRTVFAARGVGVAVSAVALPALFLTPFAHAGIFAGQWSFAAVYPMLVAIGLGVAGIAFALTLQLVRWLGARRARVAAQILGALIGASLFLGFQLLNFRPQAGEEAQAAQLMELLSSPWLSPDSMLWWPVRAFFGDPLPFAAMFIGGTTVFVVVVGATSKAFVAGTQQPAVGRARRARTTETARFERGLVRNVLRKELRLIIRDPNLIANTLLQSLYMVPLLLIMARGGDLTLLIGPAAILLLSAITGNLAWITISAEEAPDLIGSAPVNRDGMRWLKAAAALLLPAALALPFVGYYLLRDPLLAPVVVAYIALGLAASAVIQVWGGKPSPQRDLKLRQKQNIGLNFLEMLGTFAITGACALTLRGSWWAAAVLPIGMIAPIITWLGRRRDAI